MVKQIVGDLIRSAKNGEFEVIAHQCNCFNTMGSGIALSIKNEWPEAYAVDNATTKGDINKLGTITHTENTTPIIVNMYGQFDYWSKGVLTDYNALEKALVELKNKFPGKKIGMPKVGSLRARGDWAVILPIIEKVFSDPTDDVTIVEWEQDVNSTSSASNNQSSQSGSANTNYGNQTGAITKLSAFSSKSQIQAKQTPVAITNTATFTAKKKFRGKRKCKICHNYNSIKNMFNYIPGVWICKEKCQGVVNDNLNKLINQVSIDLSIKSNPALVSTPVDITTTVTA